jgi:hypothetical protein
MTRRLLIALVVLVSLVITVNTVVAEEFIWTQMTDAPVTGGYGQGLVTTGDSIYLIKCLYASSVPKFYRYDPRDDTWHTEPVVGLPQGAFRNGTALAWDGSRYIYVLGGARYSDHNRCSFFCYDTLENSWCPLPDTQYAQGAGNALTWCGYDQMLYAFVGSNSHNQGESYFLRYNPDDSSWLSLPKAWQYTEDGASLAWTGEQYIYALRGKVDETSSTGHFSRFDISSETWETLEPIPATGGVGDGGSLLYIDSNHHQQQYMLYAFPGGSALEEPGYEFYSYCINTATWTRESDIPCPVGYYVGNRLAYSEGSIYYWQGSPTTKKWECGGNAFFATTKLNMSKDPCSICLEALNKATIADFQTVNMIGEAKAKSLVEAQPFKVPRCSTANIESVLDSVRGIGEILKQRIARHFCPELYRD